MKKRGFEFIENKYRRMGICFFVYIVLIQPFSSNFLYSLDDYYLENIYVLDWENLGYNYYSYGRFAEGILAEIVSWLNLSPFNGIMAFSLWGMAVVLFANEIVDKWRVKNSVLNMVYMMLIMFNPFFVELYFYKNILGFSAFAVLSLWGGTKCIDEFGRGKKYIFLVTGGICIIFSLSVYQIFFPMIFMIYAVELFSVEKEKSLYKRIILNFVFAVFCLIIYYMILNLVFWIKPTTVDSGMRLGLLFENLLLNKNNYWSTVAAQLKRFIFKDNMLSSGIVNLAIMLMCNLCICFVFIKKISLKDFSEIRKILLAYAVFLIVQILGLLSCFGFSISNVMGTSSRSFTAWGIYSAGVLHVSEIFIKEMPTHFQRKCLKMAVAAVMAVAFLTSAARISRCASDIAKMNQIEESLVNRITARLEAYESFDPKNVKVYVHGYADLSKGYAKYFESFNHPAVGGFSTIFAFSEITGYHFSSFSVEESKTALLCIPEMGKWPAANSILETDAGFIIKLGD